MLKVKTGYTVIDKRKNVVLPLVSKTQKVAWQYIYVHWYAGWHPEDYSRFVSAMKRDGYSVCRATLTVQL